jgi:mannose PTS system EIIA component
LIGIVIVAHGGLAKEYLAAVEHVVGKQSAIETVSIDAEHDREAKKAEICKAANTVDTGQGVVVATDMFGGSPSNLSMLACQADDRKILYGVNLPALVKLTKCRHQPLNNAMDCALAAGRKYIDCCDGGV